MNDAPFIVQYEYLSGPVGAVRPTWLNYASHKSEAGAVDAAATLRASYAANGTRSKFETGTVRVIRREVIETVLETMNEEPVYWLSPLEDGCQITNTPYNGVMYDAKTPYGWANVCHDAFVTLGCRLGLGLGQKYEQQADGRWLKTGG